MDEREAGGYSVAYEREEGSFPVYVLALLSAVLLSAAWATDGIVWLVLGLAAAGAAYYNFPLIETGRPVLGANEYGIFVQGFGLIRWRSIGHIDLATIAVRASTVHELQIGLKERLSNSLVADWRKLPFWRSLMRLPWAMDHSNVVRINLEPFDHPPEEVHRTLLRMWRYYRS